jgi:hypothetical protein
VKIDPVEPPREFEVGKRGMKLRHAADVYAGDDEVVTFKTESGTELDVTRKSWGYYATPSFNGRLADFGLRAVLTVGVPRDGDEAQRMYLMLVERGHEEEFEAYLEAERMRVVAWLDGDDAVAEAARRLGS